MEYLALKMSSQEEIISLRQQVQVMQKASDSTVLSHSSDTSHSSTISCMRPLIYTTNPYWLLFLLKVGSCDEIFSPHAFLGH